MKIIKNKIIPFGTFVAMTIGPFIFTKRDKLSETVIRHESIHWEQEKETLIVFFYALYVLMFVWEFFRCLFDADRGRVDGGSWKNGTWKRAYRSIAFEREAYKHEKDEDYLSKRHHYAWIKGE